MRETLIQLSVALAPWVLAAAAGFVALVYLIALLEERRIERLRACHRQWQKERVAAGLPPY